MTATKPNASWPLPALLRSLRKAGWGILAGYEYQAVRGTLLGLADCLPDLSARGQATVLQIQASAGVSERWIRRCLNVLEDLGVIEWTRGTIIAGSPTPSYFTISKRALVHLILIARDELTRRLREHKQKYLARLQQLRKQTLPRYRKENPGSRAELSTSLTTSKEGESPFKVSDSPRKKNSKAPTTEGKMMHIPTPPKPDPAMMPKICVHAGSPDKSIIWSCPDCRAKAVPLHEWAEYEAEKIASERQYVSAPDAEADKLSMELEQRYPDMTPAQRARAYLKELKAGKR